MSLYNMINGVNPATFFILPMLGRHPDEYPRFRDCFVSNEDRPEYNNHIHVYTRTGGGNRDYYRDENDAMRAMDEYVSDFDDDFDCTYASWIFRVPDKWKEDFDLVMDGKITEISKAYQDEIRRVYPKLNEKLDAIFNQKPEQQDEKGKE